MSDNRTSGRIVGGRSVAAEGILLLVTVIWGTTFPLVKSMLGPSLHPIGLVAWRFGIAVLAFLVMFGRRFIAGYETSVMTRGLLLGTILYSGYATQTMGLELTSSSRAGFITSLYVIVTPILQLILLRRAPRASVVIGALLALIGVWGLTAPGGNFAGLVEPWGKGGVNLGDALTFTCAVTFSGYIILLDRYSGITDVLALTGWQLIAVFLLATIHASMAEPWSAPDTAMLWGKFIYLSVVATVLTTYWQTRFQAAVSPSRAAVIFTLESVFGAIFSHFFLGERLGPIAIAGAGLIVAGILVVELAGRRDRA